MSAIPCIVLLWLAAGSPARSTWGRWWSSWLHLSSLLYSHPVIFRGVFSQDVGASPNAMRSQVASDFRPGHMSFDVRTSLTQAEHCDDANHSPGLGHAQKDSARPTVKVPPKAHVRHFEFAIS